MLIWGTVCSRLPLKRRPMSPVAEASGVRLACARALAQVTAEVTILVISVTDWLKELGLEQYAPAFRNNDIDGVVLPELTADDLTGLA